MLSLLMGMIKCFQITQSNKFAISLQYLKKEVGNGDHFWHADKRQSFYKLVFYNLQETYILIQTIKLKYSFFDIRSLMYKSLFFSIWFGNS